MLIFAIIHESYYINRNGTSIIIIATDQLLTVEQELGGRGGHTPVRPPIFQKGGGGAASSDNQAQ